MRIKDLMNEFEIDRAAMPGVGKNTIEKLSGKTVALFGGTLARCLCHAFLYQNDERGTKIKVIIVSSPKKSECYADFAQRNDFEFVRLDSVSKIKSVDSIVFTGLCCEQTDNDENIIDAVTNEAEIVGDLANRTGARVTAVSDSRIYGVSKPHRIYSENEYSQLRAGSPSAIAGRAMRAYEKKLRDRLQADKCALTVLRTGIILDAAGDFSSPTDAAFSDIAIGRNTKVPYAKERHTFVYVDDVIKAVVYAMTELKTNEIYNVGGKNSTVSLLMIYAVLCELYGERCKIEVGDFANIEDCAINCGKISFYGCPPRVDLTEMLELCVMGKAPKTSDFKIPYSHEGRLESIHQIQLSFLYETDRICKKHNIKYFLGGGTLLGAVRHKGFIPWDDDADIMMLREDYDKFCKVAPSELPENMTFQSYRTDKACFYEFAKIRLDGTVFSTDFAKEHRTMHNGIAFDIFCHDKTANSKIGRKIHISLTLFARALVFNKWNDRKAQNGSKTQSFVTNLCKKIFPLRFSMWLENRILKFFKNKKNAKYLYDGMGRNIYNGAFPASCLDEAVYTDFEGCRLPIPKKYDEYLTFLYGDYMQLPPVSERVGCHEITLCDIGKYDGYRFEPSLRDENF